MQDDELSEKIDSAYSQLASLQKRVVGSNRMDQIAVEALEELGTTLEELQVTSAELAKTNEDLSAAKDMLAEQSKRYKELFDFAPDGYLITTANGTIKEASLMALKQLGVRKKFLIGKPLSVFVSKNDEKALFQALEKLSSGKQKEIEGLTLTMQPPKSQSFPAFVGISCTDSALDGEKKRKPARKADRLELRWLVRDISELKEREEELRRSAEQLTFSNAELEQYAYVVAHHLKEPARIVATYAQLLANSIPERLSRDAIKSINFITSSAEQMQVIIRDLLAYSRVEASEQKYKTVELENVMQEVLSHLSESLKETGGKVVYKNLPSVYGSRSQIVYLFENLISNALKFNSDPNPKVTISATRKGNDLVFSVRDNGIGVDKEFRDKIFHLFYRLHKVDKYPGSGIGLPICKKIVEQHGGRIWVEAGRGGGSVFRFTLPST